MWCDFEKNNIECDGQLVLWSFNDWQLYLISCPAHFDEASRKALEWLLEDPKLELVSEKHISSIMKDSGAYDE